MQNKFNSVKEFISWVEHQKRFSPKVSLDKMRYYCNLFDNPQSKFASIHITGTNGKGSVVSYLRTIYMEKGLNVGTFTSPYITIFNERISYNNNPISDEDLLRIGNLIIDKYEIIENDGYELPTFFEFITLICFIYFAGIKELDIAVIEVGMGGRLDATNVINPLVSIITNVTLEHENILGSTKEEILIQKLGIVKKNIPLVTSIKEDELLKVINNYLDDSNKLYLTDNCEIISSDIRGNVFKLNNIKFKTKLLGLHQITNALTAIKTVEVINKLSIDNFHINNQTLKNGIYKTLWPGRLEKVSNKPIILIDGGHNIDGISKTCEFIKNIKSSCKTAYVSISADKNLSEMINIIDNTFDEVIFTKYTYARSADPNDLYKLSQNKNKRVLNLDDAVEDAFKNKSKLNIFIGSLYLVSEVRPKILKRRK